MDIAPPLDRGGLDKARLSNHVSVVTNPKSASTTIVEEGLHYLG